MLPERSRLKLRLCCKQLKQEIDHLVGLLIRVFISSNFKNDCENYEWVKQILIRKLTLESAYGNVTVHSPWTSFLTNGGFINLSRLSLSGLKLPDKGELARNLTVLSTLSSLRELSLYFFDQRFYQSVSSIPRSTENVYDFPNLTTLNLDFAYTIDYNVSGGDITYLKSFHQIDCPQLKSLSVRLHTRKHQLETLVWYLELVEKFSNSLQYLQTDIRIIGAPSYNRNLNTIRANTEKKAFRVGSQLTNLKEIDVALLLSIKGVVSGWINFLLGIRTSLEILKIDFRGYRVWKYFSESALLKKNSFPNLKSLSLTWNSCNLDLERTTRISNRLEILALSPPANYGSSVGIISFPLSLKKLALRNSLRGMESWIFLKKCISARESLLVQYDQLMGIEWANYLGVFLTKPNFSWKGIEWRDQVELTAASALCEKFAIPYAKLYEGDHDESDAFRVNYIDVDVYDDSEDSD